MSKINDIATMAAGLIRPTKREVFPLVRELANGRPVTDKDLATLYSFFLPPVPKNQKPKNLEQWVAMAKGVNDVRVYFNYLYSDGKTLTGTDGHRLHQIKTDLPRGFYDSELVKVDCQFNYPDVSKVIPDKKTSKHCVFDLSECKTEVEDADTRNPKPVMEVAPGVWVQKQYLMQALSGYDNPQLYYNGPRDAVMFVMEGGRIAVIMPIKRGGHE